MNMKQSTILLVAILVLGLLYSFIKLFTGRGGSGLGDFIYGIGWTSVFLFFAALTIIVSNIRRIRKYSETFIFLFLGLPMTLVAANGLLHSIHYNRTPDLTPKYPRPVSQATFSADSKRISIQVDSLIALKNRETHGIKVASAFVDTIIYSESGKEVFVIYAKQFEPNHLGNDLDPDYLSADERDSVYWHLREGTPNAVRMSGSYRNIDDLRKAVRKFYFNQYSFRDADSLKENYFWERNETLGQTKACCLHIFYVGII
jgi:hypothetical protein